MTLLSQCGNHYPLLKCTAEYLQLKSNLKHLSECLPSRRLIAPLLGGNSANAMESWSDGSCCLKLKGQMRYMPKWESIIFLGTPV